MSKKKKPSRIWNYRRSQNGWEVIFDGKSQGVVVFEGSGDRQKSWRSSGKSGEFHLTRNEAAAALLSHKQR